MAILRIDKAALDEFLEDSFSPGGSDIQRSRVQVLVDQGIRVGLFRSTKGHEVVHAANAASGGSLRTSFVGSPETGTLDGEVYRLFGLVDGLKRSDQFEDEQAPLPYAEV